MSQIFDALHRSETERGRINPHTVTAAPELLEAAERQLAQGTREDKRQSAGMEAGHFSSPFQSATVVAPSLDKLACLNDGDRLVAEKFRFLGVRLRQLQQKRPFKRLLITSSVPGEGKSTIAANLACTLARKLQQKVLLLEGDLRRPALEQQFGHVVMIVVDGEHQRSHAFGRRYIHIGTGSNQSFDAVRTAVA